MQPEQRPYEAVEVGVDIDYVSACETYGGGPNFLDSWKELGDLLAYRTGWHFDIVNRGEALWSLGFFGESLLNISVAAGGSDATTTGRERPGISCLSVKLQSGSRNVKLRDEGFQS